MKTSSGKIARQRVRRAYLEGSLSVIAEWREALDGTGGRYVSERLKGDENEEERKVKWEKEGEK